MRRETKRAKKGELRKEMRRETRQKDEWRKEMRKEVKKGEKERAREESGKLELGNDAGKKENGVCEKEGEQESREGKAGEMKER